MFAIAIVLTRVTGKKYMLKHPMKTLTVITGVSSAYSLPTHPSNELNVVLFCQNQNPFPEKELRNSHYMEIVVAEAQPLSDTSGFQASAESLRGRKPCFWNYNTGDQKTRLGCFLP
jgi:hypothetical protein